MTGDQLATPGSTTRIWPAAVAVLLLLAVVGVMAGLVLTSRGDDEGSEGPVPQDDPATVQLEPVGYRSPEPFTDSVVTADDAELEALAESPNITVPTGDTVRGDTSLLYGSRRARPVCDVERLAAMLTDDPEVTRSWADAAGVAPDRVAATVRALSPVVLTTDTAVTNHIYGDGTARAYQSVLQSGTPVLIDDRGTPRAQCSCGNPLLPPDRADDADYVGDPWEDFDSGSVIEVEPAEEPANRIPTIDLDSDEPVATPVGETVTLDGLLVSTAEGVHVADDDDVTTVIDQPVEAVYDDGDGGLIYTLDRSDLGPEDYEEGPPAEPDQAVIWHLPAGANEAEPLIEPEADGQWNRLLGVGQLGEHRYVVFAPLVAEQVYDGVDAPTGPIEVMQLGTGERTVLLEQGIGWELSIGSVSFGGDLLALEGGYAAPEWLVFDQALQPVDNVCDAGDGNEDTYDTCPWAGALDADGRLVFFTSELADDPEAVTSEALRRLDLRNGEVSDMAVSEVWGVTPESRTAPTQIIDERLAAYRTVSDSPSNNAAVVVDLSNGAPTFLDDVHSNPVESLWMLTAPLLRPVVDDEPTPEEPTDTPPRPDVDPMNTMLPANTCSQGPEDPLPAVTLVDGSATIGDDPMTAPFVNMMTDPESATWTDMDGDGTEDLVMFITCNWGGTGYSQNVVAIRGAGTDAPELIAPALLEYYRSKRSADAIVVESPGVVAISGQIWTDADPMCCPSGPVETARWTIRDGEWVEV